MHTVWKYTINLREATQPGGVTENLDIPRGWRFLTAKDRMGHTEYHGFAVQAPHIDMWFEVNTDEPKETVTFDLYGTGYEIPDVDVHRYYLATVFPVHGLVLHIFEHTKDTSQD